MTHKRRSFVSRYLGKIGWFYVGSILSVTLIVMLVRLAYGQMQWDWVGLRGHVMVTLGIFVIITFGPFAVFDLATRAVESLNNAPKPHARFFLVAGLVYPFLLLLYGLLGIVLKSHFAMFLFMISLFALTFLLPWFFVKLLEKCIKRMQATMQGPPVINPRR